MPRRASCLLPAASNDGELLSGDDSQGIERAPCRLAFRHQSRDSTTIKQVLVLSLGLSLGAAACAQDTSAAPSTIRTPLSQSAQVQWRSQQPAGALSEAAIKTAIANAGYKQVKDLEFDDGVWSTKARGGNDKWVELSVGPVSGKVYPADAPSSLNPNEVKAKLAAAGYQNVHDVEFKHGLWSVDAKTSAGEEVDVLVDPGDGSVIAKSSD